MRLLNYKFIKKTYDCNSTGCKKLNYLVLTLFERPFPDLSGIAFSSFLNQSFYIIALIIDGGLFETNTAQYQILIY